MTRRYQLAVQSHSYSRVTAVRMKKLATDCACAKGENGAQIPTRHGLRVLEGTTVKMKKLATDCACAKGENGAQMPTRHGLRVLEGTAVRIKKLATGYACSSVSVANLYLSAFSATVGRLVARSGCLAATSLLLPSFSGEHVVDAAASLCSFHVTIRLKGPMYFSLGFYNEGNTNNIHRFY